MNTFGNIVATLIGAIVALGIIFGLFKLLEWDYASDKKHWQEQCAQVAELSSVKEYKVVDGQCVIVKDGKLVEIK